MTQLHHPNYFRTIFQYTDVIDQKKTSEKSGKGGVLIAVNKCYESELLTTCENDGCEQVWIRIKNNNKTIYKHIKYTTKQNTDLPSSMSYKNHTVNTPNDIADSFGSFFQSVYSESINNVIDNYNQTWTINKKLSGICSIIPPVTINEKEIRGAFYYGSSRIM